MSLSLATAWIRNAVQQPGARHDALKLFEESTAKGVDGTLIIGPQLSANGKCYLARWDGRELVVLELSPTQQQEWNVQPHGLFQQLDPTGLLMPNLVTDPLVGLSEVRFGTAAYDGLTPLSGICHFETDCPAHRPVERVALRLKYFRPDLPHAVTAMWYAGSHVRAPGGEFQFQFPPVFSKKDLSNLHGTMVVFLQMFTAEDWRRMAGCRKISNVASAVIHLQ